MSWCLARSRSLPPPASIGACHARNQPTIGAVTDEKVDIFTYRNSHRQVELAGIAGPQIHISAETQDDRAYALTRASRDAGVVRRLDVHLLPSLGHPCHPDGKSNS